MKHAAWMMQGEWSTKFVAENLVYGFEWAGSHANHANHAVMQSIPV